MQLTIKDMNNIDPRVGDLVRMVESAGGMTDREWQLTYKPMVSSLVGWDSCNKDHPVLGTQEAYSHLGGTIYAMEYGDRIRL
jgi:hypothetical protein